MVLSQSLRYVSLSLDAEGEEVRWQVTICIKLDFIVKSIRDSPRPSQTQGVPPELSTQTLAASATESAASATDLIHSVASRRQTCHNKGC